MFNLSKNNSQLPKSPKNIKHTPKNTRKIKPKQLKKIKIPRDLIKRHRAIFMTTAGRKVSNARNKRWPQLSLKLRPRRQAYRLAYTKALPHNCRDLAEKIYLHEEHGYAKLQYNWSSTARQNHTSYTVYGHHDQRRQITNLSHRPSLIGMGPHMVRYTVIGLVWFAQPLTRSIIALEMRCDSAVGAVY